MTMSGNHGFPESKVHRDNMGPTWVLSAPYGPHVGPMNLAIKVLRKYEQNLTYRTPQNMKTFWHGNRNHITGPFWWDLSQSYSYDFHLLFAWTSQVAGDLWLACAITVMVHTDSLHFVMFCCHLVPVILSISISLHSLPMIEPFQVMQPWSPWVTRNCRSVIY